MQKDIACISSALRSNCGKLCMAVKHLLLLRLCCLEYFLEHLLLLTVFDGMMYLRA